MLGNLISPLASVLSLVLLSLVQVLAARRTDEHDRGERKARSIDFG